MSPAAIWRVYRHLIRRPRALALGAEAGWLALAVHNVYPVVMNSLYSPQINTNVPPPPAASSEVADSIQILEMALMRLDGTSLDILSRLEPAMRPELLTGSSSPAQANAPVYSPLSSAIRAGAEQVDAICTRLNSVLQRLAL